MFLCVKIKFVAITPKGQEPIFNFSATICFWEADLFGKPYQFIFILSKTLMIITIIALF